MKHVGNKAAAVLMVLALTAFSFDSDAQYRRSESRPSTSGQDRPSSRPQSGPSSKPASRPSSKPSAKPAKPSVKPDHRPQKPAPKPNVKPGGPQARPPKPAVRPAPPVRPRPVVRPRPIVRPRPVVIRPSYGTIIAANIARDMALTAVNMAYVNSLIQQNNALAAQLGVVQSIADANEGYLYHDGVFYSKNAQGEYVVMVPPAGALVEALPDDFETLTIDGKEYYRVEDTIYGLVVVDGKPCFEVIGQLYK